MIVHLPAREAPQPSLGSGPGPCRPEAPCEPVLDLRNIQGNILAGFNKDFQTLLFLEITEVVSFRKWLKELTCFVATSEEVLAFNRLFKEIRSRRGDSRTVQATWMNLAFSARGLRKLAPGEAEKLKDEAFQQGLAERSARLGDPARGEGSPESWVVGGPDNEADLVLIFAADDKNDLFAEVSRIEDSIYSARTPAGDPMRCGVRIVYKQHGATLPPPLTGHEHFGFLDGVSQPGLRGRISERPWDVLTLRQNPDDPDGQGKPGQDLLWPGEFVFGYPGQDPGAESIAERGPNSLRPLGEPVAPDWARDGSYLVFRRLRQDVRGFRDFLQKTAGELKMDEELLGAKLVGRWKSGAPIMRTPDHDDPKMGGNDCVNNDFEFASDAESDAEEAAEAAAALRKEAADCLCKKEKDAEPDDDGLKCPFAGHIRKTYPRNDSSTFKPDTNEETTQTHRLLRRGIPFGAPYPLDPPADLKDSGDRGLLFLAYQTSIVEQFEFVQTQWCNQPEFKDKTVDGELLSGHDLIIGQNGAEGRKRQFVLPVPGKDGKIERRVLETDQEWVIPTGGGYFFAPSLRALGQLAEGTIKGA